MATPTLFKDKGYKGKSEALTKTAYENSRTFSLGNDCVSSIRVPQELTVLLYEDSNFRGACRRCTTDQGELGSLNDKTTSIVVIPSALINDLVYAIDNPAAVGRSALDLSNELFQWALQSLSKSPDTVLRVLADSGVPRGELAKQATRFFQTSVENVVRLMDMSAEQTARVLKDAFGWPAKKTGAFLKDVMDFGKGTVEDALDGAGYAKSEIEGFLRSAGDWAEGIGRDIAGAFGL
jgi:hypothetical protein